MLKIRHAHKRGKTDFEWLKSNHSFSFGDYIDPAHHHFHALRVINDDIVAPGAGFPTHPHRDMEILTYMLSGELEHKDSMGHGAVLNAGEWQHMTAGRGILHSEFNPSATTPAHLLQIWIFPREKGLKPGYSQKPFAAKPGKWRWVATPDGRDESLMIQTDALVAMAEPKPGDTLTYTLAADRAAWIQVATGAVVVNGVTLKAGDGLAVDAEPTLELTGQADAKVVLFDLARV
jgi:hypothetical protein